MSASDEAGVPEDLQNQSGTLAQRDDDLGEHELHRTAQEQGQTTVEEVT